MNINLIIVFLVTLYENVNSLQHNITNTRKYTKYNEPKIVGGVDATFNGIKHIVSIRLWRADTPFGRGHICGGSLLNHTTVITAAHCFLNLQYNPPRIRNANEFKVVMGTLNKMIKTSYTFESHIDKIILHNNFSFLNMRNDIGLMILKDSVPTNNPYIQKIQLANKLPKHGVICRVDGWGSLNSGSYSPDQLQTVNISIISNNICKQSYQDKLKDGMFCAGNWYKGGKDSCQGDSGGPLTCNNTLVGVVSWGDKCGYRYFPGIYTDISYFENWIQTVRSSSTNNIIKWQFNYFIILLIICQFFLN